MIWCQVRKWVAQDERSNVHTLRIPSFQCCLANAEPMCSSTALAKRNVHTIMDPVFSVPLLFSQSRTIWSPPGRCLCLRRFFRWTRTWTWTPALFFGNVTLCYKLIQFLPLMSLLICWTSYRVKRTIGNCLVICVLLSRLKVIIDGKNLKIVTFIW